VEDTTKKYRCPAILNAGHGVRFTSAAFTKLLHDHGIPIRMNGKGR